MFVHLHVHSAYSLLNGGAGASSLEALAEAALERGMSTLALTDVNGVYGAMDFRRVAEAYGLRPVYGVSLETATERAVLLPLDAVGWASLCRAVTARHNDAHFVLRHQLSVDRGGLAVLSSDTALLDAVARESGTEQLYVELVPGRGREAAQAFARRHGVPPVVTNAVWFAHPQDHARHRLLAAIARNATLTTLPAGALAPRDAWLKPGPEMARLFPDCAAALRNAVELAERCGGGPPAGRVILPAFAGADALAKLRELTVLGARWRYGAEILSPVVHERIEHELAIIATKHYADYFLVVWDVVTPGPPRPSRRRPRLSLGRARPGVGVRVPEVRRRPRCDGGEPRHVPAQGGTAGGRQGLRSPRDGDRGGDQAAAVGGRRPAACAARDAPELSIAGAGRLLAGDRLARRIARGVAAQPLPAPRGRRDRPRRAHQLRAGRAGRQARSEEHTSELQSR